MEVIRLVFLYERYDNASKDGFKNFREDIPSYITDNLKYSLRSYQQEALGRYLYYKTDLKFRVLPEQVLFNMATGSGKTLLMAAIILEKYMQGERNFIFFVNNSNIITKSRDNFLNSTSSKYLFADRIVIEGKVVNIKEVTDFSDAQADNINIIFTTIQKLHQDLNTPRENRLSYEQFEDISVVLLADEAHHLNAGLKTKEKEENNTWTSTVENIKLRAKKASIFEYTATIDLSDKDIAKKYENSILYKYDLKEFRLDGYSKDVLFHLVGSDIVDRMLQAIIISQYRKKVALAHNINLKPLILFKSKAQKDSRVNLTNFNDVLSNLTLETIQRQRDLAIVSSEDSQGILSKAFNYFRREGITDDNLISELQEDFRPERLMLIDGSNKTEKKLVELNTLEDPSNEIRAIFAVDMLNEGWDVLNLFDIVRLYDSRDGRVKKSVYEPGATTIQEKQLIGRGARYFPFVYEEEVEKKYKRKFDSNENAELRVIEQLHYHSANNTRYISELKQVLIESGIFDDIHLVTRELRLKEAFKTTRTYQNGGVWMNKRMPKSINMTPTDTFDSSYIPKSLEVEIPLQVAYDIEVFSDANINDDDTSIRISFKFGKVVEPYVIRHAINRNKKFTFDKLEKAFFGLQSTEGFIKMLDNVEIRLTSGISDAKLLSQDDKLYVAERLLENIEKDLDVEKRYYGSQDFEYFPLKEVFDDCIIRKYTINDLSNAELGVSQKDRTQTQYYENLDELPWYAYDDNFGTSEEKLLVSMLKDLMSELEEKWTDIYLLRNERAVRIYSFENGQAFEPDFLLFANDKKTGNVSWQIFIEPKGSQFLDSNKTFTNGKEGWKEEFLKQITERDEARTLLENEHYRIVGLPFFNDVISKDAVREKLRELK